MKLERQKHCKHNILIADTNYLFRKGLRALFGSDPEFHLIREAGNELELLAALGQGPAEILLASVDLLRGNSVTAFIQNNCPQIRVVCLTSDPPGDIDLDSLPSADLLIARSHAPVKLLEHVRSLMWPEPSAAQQTSDLRALVATGQTGRPDLLTNREKEVVRLLAEGLTVREAAVDLGLSCKTVEAHTLNLMRKLNIHDRSSLIEYAVGSGMVDNRAAV